MATNTSILGLTKPAYTDDADVAVINSNSDLIDAESGRLRGNFAGTYSDSSSYAVGAFCIYQGNLYRCTTAIGSGGESWNSSHWTQTKAGTELTSLSEQIAKQVISATKNSTYIAGTTISGYKIGSLVVIEGYFTVATEIPVGTDFFTFGSLNKFGVNVFAIIFKTDNSLFRNVYVPHNGNTLKPNGQSIPQGEYAIHSFTYITE